MRSVRIERSKEIGANIAAIAPPSAGIVPPDQVSERTIRRDSRVREQSQDDGAMQSRLGAKAAEILCLVSIGRRPIGDAFRRLPDTIP